MLRTRPLVPTTGPEILDSLRRGDDARQLNDQQRRTVAEFIALNTPKYHLTIQALVSTGIAADTDEAEELLYQIS